MRRIVATILLFAALLPTWTVHAATLQEGPLIVEYSAEDADAAQRAMRELREAAAEFGQRLPLGGKPVNVFIAPSVAAFHRRAPGFMPGQVSGVADPERGLITVKSPRLRGARADFLGTLRHELVHILVERNTKDVFMPRWLNEGLAMFMAKEYQFATPMTMAMMFFENRLIEYKDLDRAFMNPGQEMEFGDAYAQALSLTRHLYKRLGPDRFWQVVLATHTMPFPDALRQYGGFDVRELCGGYIRSLWLVVLIGAMASGSFFAPMSVLTIVAWFSVRRQRRKVLAGWAREEEEESLRNLVDPKPPIMTWEEAIDDPTTYIPGIDDEEDEDRY
jgi:hypothetical protein